MMIFLLMYFFWLTIFFSFIPFKVNLTWKWSNRILQLATTSADDTPHTFTPLYPSWTNEGPLFTPPVTPSDLPVASKFWWHDLDWCVRNILSVFLYLCLSVITGVYVFRPVFICIWIFEVLSAVLTSPWPVSTWHDLEYCIFSFACVLIFVFLTLSYYFWWLYL